MKGVRQWNIINTVVSHVRFEGAKLNGFVVKTSGITSSSQNECKHASDG